MKNSIIIASFIVSISLILSSVIVCLKTQKVEKQIKKIVTVIEEKGIVIDGYVHTMEHQPISFK